MTTDRCPCSCFLSLSQFVPSNSTHPPSYDDHIPLVVPEINAAAIQPHDRLIANPNCTTAIAVMALYPLHQRFGIRRIVCSTYQAREMCVCE